MEEKAQAVKRASESSICNWRRFLRQLRGGLLAVPLKVTGDPRYQTGPQWRQAHRAKPHAFQGCWATLSPAEHTRPLGYVNSAKIWTLLQCLQWSGLEMGQMWAKTAFTSRGRVLCPSAGDPGCHLLSCLTDTEIHMELPLNLKTGIFWEKKRENKARTCTRRNIFGIP